ncbi:MAG: DUF2157 domain-containing protein [Candidatus Omnitrophota bacterium]
MAKRAVKWLYQELPELVAKGILTADSAEKLRKYYGEIKETGKRWALLVIFGVIGAFLIGLGIILLLAHNWEQFSRFSRAIISLLPLLAAQGLAGWVIIKRPQSAAFKEGSAVFLSLMVGASIALISQTYNIPGDTEIFILTWMLLILPVVYLMQVSLPAAIYLIGITSWAGSYSRDPQRAILFWPLAVAALPHFVWALRQEAYKIRGTLLSLAIIICVNCGVSFSLGKAWPGSWVVIFPSLYTIFYAFSQKKFKGVTANWQRSWRALGGLGILALAFSFTYRYIWQGLMSPYYGYENKVSGLAALSDNILTLVIVAMALVLFYDFLRRKDLSNSLFCALPLLGILGYSLRGGNIVLTTLIFNGYLLALSLSRIMLGIRKNNLGEVNAGMLILGLLIILRFFDSNIGFIIKGLVFIIVGIGFLTANIMLARRGGGR